VLDDTAVPRLNRLMRWLERFTECFGHAAQLVSFGSYVNGLLSDSPRKSMEAMLARVTDAPRYQAFQHFITHAPWEADRVWRRLLAVLPVRRGILLLDDTGFRKQGKHSVAVARQYSGTLGKIGSCQIAVTAALWAASRAWVVGAALYLPKAWLDDPDRCAKVRVPPKTRFQEKWRLALTLLRRVRAAGIAVTAVVADAGYGDVVLFRAALHRLKLPYALGVSSTTTVFPGPPPLVVPPPTGHRGRPRIRPVLVGAPPISVAALARSLPADGWQRIQWRNGDRPPRAADFVACRVTPAHDWQRGRLGPQVWLLCERRGGDTPEEKFYLINLPPRRSLARLVDLAHRRWAIEQQYAETKTELGLDHFEGRSYPGWNHHVVITAVAYAFLQQERHAGTTDLTFPQVRAIVQEIFTGLFFAAHPRYLDWIQRARELLPLRLV
jgi:SRSO17 transposase